jgi:hypothetical protein
VSEAPTSASAASSSVAVYPLSEWMRGTLTVVLDSGGTYATECSAYMATQVRRVVAGQRGGDALSWADSWLEVDPAKVALLQWRTQDDYGWTMSDDSRQSQRACGHRHGVLATLVEQYGGGAEPSFSVDAICALSVLAGQAGPDEVLRYAEMLKGADGATKAAAMWAEAPRPATAAHPSPGQEHPAAPSERDGSEQTQQPMGETQ